MAERELPSPELLRKLLRYEPETGKLFWLERPREFFTSERESKRWNGRYSGKEAFTSKNDKGYFGGKIGRRTFTAHRVAWALHYGEWPDQDIDHIDGNRANNKIYNLRDVARSENAKNAALRSDNASGCSGVVWHKRDANWCVQISINGRRVHIGSFEEKNDAIAARRAAEKMFGFHPNHGRVR